MPHWYAPKEGANRPLWPAEQRILPTMNKPMTKRIFAAGSAGLLLALGLFISGCSSNKDNANVITTGPSSTAQGGSKGRGHGKKGKGGPGGPPATPVIVTTVSNTGTISDSVYVTGSIATLFDDNLAAQTTGEVTYVGVQAGDAVKKGQLLIKLDPSVAEAAVQQDQANVANDQAKVQQAQLQYSQSITNANVAINQARQQLTAAEQNLITTKFPYQPQQIAQMRDQVVQQQTNATNAQTYYEREALLYKEGVIAASDYDNAYTSYKTQAALLANYQEALKLAEAGGRTEQVKAAEQTVKEQQQNLRNAIANLAQVRVNREAITAAQDTVKAAEYTLQQAQAQLQYTNIYSPINGFVQTRSTDPGQVATPGTTLLELVDLHTVYFEPSVSEDDFRKLALGQLAEVNVDAYPGRTFTGHIGAVYPAASTTDRQFSVRVDIPNPGSLLRPGMYARGSIITRTDHNVIVVPTTALVASLPPGYTSNLSSNAVSYGNLVLPPETVFIVGPGNKAIQKPVKVGIEANSEAEILSGLSPGDQLITTGQGLLQPGSPVTVENQTAQAPSQ